VAPQSRIVYVDNDQIVLAHAQALLASAPEGRTAYIDADLRDPEAILASPAWSWCRSGAGQPAPSRPRRGQPDARVQPTISPAGCLLKSGSVVSACSSPPGVYVTISLSVRHPVFIVECSVPMGT
jgi:hypothetical protein